MGGVWAGSKVVMGGTGRRHAELRYKARPVRVHAATPCRRQAEVEHMSVAAVTTTRVSSPPGSEKEPTNLEKGRELEPCPR